MSAFADITARARDELAANPGLRLGVWVIAAILSGYFAFVVQADRVDAASAEYASSDSRLARGKDLLARQDWAERLSSARAIEADLTAKFWHAPNEGLAQASLRAALDDLTARIHLDQPRVDLGSSRPVADAPGLWRVQVRIVAQGVGPSTLRLLHRIASHPRKLVAERLELTRNRGSMRLELLISAYFLLDDAAGSTDDREI